MKRIALLAVAACVLGTAACTVRTERTVVERPVPDSTAAVVVPDSPPPATVIVHDHD